MLRGSVCDIFGGEFFSRSIGWFIWYMSRGAYNCYLLAMFGDILSWARGNLKMYLIGLKHILVIHHYDYDHVFQNPLNNIHTIFTLGCRLRGLRLAKQQVAWGPPLWGMGLRRLHLDCSMFSQSHAEVMKRKQKNKLIPWQHQISVFEKSDRFLCGLGMGGTF